MPRLYRQALRNPNYQRKEDEYEKSMLHEYVLCIVEVACDLPMSSIQFLKI